MKIQSFIKILIICCLSFLFNSCYLLTQGAYLLHYNSSARNTEKILKDPLTQSKTRKLFALVNEIRNFTQDSLGLVKNSNYTRYVKVDRDYLVDVVSAAQELSFKQYMWCFPFFGCFPNKGFFKRSDAERAASKLSKKGYDVIIDKVDAFSTLGILSDPLYSFMEDFTLFQIASVIIHEQTHATLFIKNQLQFNEELATYIGIEGTLQFIEYHNGTDTTYCKKVKQYLNDQETYLRLLRKLYRDLESMYTMITDSSEARIRKKAMIENFKSDIMLHYDSLFVTKNFRSIQDLDINNAFLAIRMTYTLDLGLFDTVRTLTGGNLKNVIDYVKKFENSKNPKEDIQNAIKKLTLNNDTSMIQ